MAYTEKVAKHDQIGRLIQQLRIQPMTPEAHALSSVLSHHHSEVMAWRRAWTDLKDKINSHFNNDVPKELKEFIKKQDWDLDTWKR